MNFKRSGADIPEALLPEPFNHGVSLFPQNGRPPVEVLQEPQEQEEMRREWRTILNCQLSPCDFYNRRRSGVGKMDQHIELPEKYKTLSDLFNEMESSIRLLAMQKELPTFGNICTQVELRTNMKFLYSHLAQMKHVYPEAIHVEKILVHDKKRFCMKEEMRIILARNGAEFLRYYLHGSLCEAFHAKLSQLFVTSREGADIPEALLPEPFNRGDYCFLNRKPPARPLIEVDG